MLLSFSTLDLPRRDPKLYLLLEEMMEEDEDEEEEDEDSSWNTLICLTVPSGNWPFCLDHPFFHPHSLFTGTANDFFLHADSSSLEVVTRLDHSTFSLLMDKYKGIWEKSMCH